MTGRGRRLTWLPLVLLAGGLLAGCQTELPQLSPGRRISGQVRYVGQAHTGYGRPALQVVALAEIPSPDRIKRPHALTILEPGQYDAPVGYELGPLPPFRYRVVARLIDLTNLTLPVAEVPTGSWPNVCDLLTAPAGNVEVTEAAPTAGIDVTIYDRAGAADPCHAGQPPVTNPELCPQAGAGTLQVTLRFTRPAAQIVPPDQLNFAVLTDLTVFPTRFRLRGAAELSFPYPIVFNDVPPDSYLVVACYDVGGNNLTGCGMEDFSASYMSMQKLAVAAGKITRVELDLDTKAGTLLAVDDPAAHGCR